MDIVERLRWSVSADTPARYPEIVREAADTIERLRARIAELEAIMIARQNMGKWRKSK